MKRFFLGGIVGLITGMILAITTLVFAAGQPIKLIVNGKEIQCDVPPQEINGRVLVPARFLAEALGAKVDWDGERNAVVVMCKLTSTQLTTADTNDTIDDRITQGGDRMEWISLRNLIERHNNVEVMVSESEIIIKGNNKELRFTRQLQSDWQTTNNGVTLKTQGGISYIDESQLRQYGIIN